MQYSAIEREMEEEKGRRDNILLAFIYHFAYFIFRMESNDMKLWCIETMCWSMQTHLLIYKFIFKAFLLCCVYEYTEKEKEENQWQNSCKCQQWNFIWIVEVNSENVNAIAIK